MEQEKFLTVFAVFDEQTQRELKTLQDGVLGLGFVGTQTMDIPFHISLGTYPVKDKDELTAKIKKVCVTQKVFDIDLVKVNHFNNRVLFVEPDVNADLKNLHDIFNGNFQGNFNWHAHATIYCGEENEVEKAKRYLKKTFKPLRAKVVSIQMGEFFPTKLLDSCNLALEK